MIQQGKRLRLSEEESYKKGFSNGKSFGYKKSIADGKVIREKRQQAIRDGLID